MRSDNMVQKTYLYEWQRNDLENLSEMEIRSFKKADELNDKILDLKILIEEINYEWDEYLQFLEDEKISKVCEFRGEECIEFSDELLNSIVNTLKKSLNDTKDEINYNSKKIKLNLVVNG